MVYAIWSCLLVIIATGIAMAGVPGSGEASHDLRTMAAARQLPSADRDDATRIDEDERGEAAAGTHAGEERGDREEGPLVEIHETAANLLYLLILLHIAGVIFETRRNGRQVVLAMLPGHR